MIEALSPVLVANRGEIAVRVMATCRRLGVRTVAVYSDADAYTAHVAAADRAVHIGASPAVDSYLNQERILTAADETGARAVHPGYGFLAENADFAQRVLDAGLVWIGPSPAAMRAIGDKAGAKALAEQHQVPLLAGYHGADLSLPTLREHAAQIGYPLLIKASAGGGGRGMRIVERPDDLETALESARREAAASFGDDRVLLERYVVRPRHVEVQIVGDSRGEIIYLGERECSVQRRYQKLIEESPSPAVDDALRQRMGEAALRLARAASYTNAGTVEFILDQRGDFAFLEVNARLQVEHPVTEAVTGLDLVELQLRVAAGEPLPLSQADVRVRGHAIEARVIAEDALAGFLPSSGRLSRYSAPGGVRIDTWIGEATLVSPYYDSLLAKVIAHAPTRVAAVHQLASALRDLRIDGVRHNADLLLATLESPAFVAGDLHTGFLAEHQVIESLRELPLEVLAAASAVDSLRSPAGDPWSALNGWRLGRLDQPATWTRAGVAHSVTVTADLGEGGLTVAAGGRTVHVERLIGDAVIVEGQTLLVSGDEDARVVEWQGRSYRLERGAAVTVEQTAGEAGRRGGGGSLVAPMPGRIVKVAVHQGDHVQRSQPLVVLEAMKMEHVVEAPYAGVVTELRVGVGDQVAGGARLLTLGSADADAQTVE